VSALFVGESSVNTSELQIRGQRAAGIKQHAIRLVLRLRVDLEPLVQVFLRAGNVSLGNKNIRQVGLSKVQFCLRFGLAFDGNC
jgi:hypothetical protein